MSTGLGSNLIPNLANTFQGQNPVMTTLTLTHFETPTERFRVCAIEDVRYYAALPIATYSGEGQNQRFDVFGVVGVSQAQSDVLRARGIETHKTTLLARPEADSKNRESYDDARYVWSPLWTKQTLAEPHKVFSIGMAANQSTCSM